MNYGVKNQNENRNAITILWLTSEIRIRAMEGQKLSASVYIPWNEGRLLQRFEMSPKRLFVQTEKTTLSMYIILHAGAHSSTAEAFQKSLCASICLKASRQLLPPPQRNVSSRWRTFPRHCVSFFWWLLFAMWIVAIQTDSFLHNATCCQTLLMLYVMQPY